MNLYEVTYVTFTFKNTEGKDVEKTRTYLVIGENEEDAKKNFLNKEIKHKRISQIKEDNSNTIGNICPELIELRNKML